MKISKNRLVNIEHYFFNRGYWKVARFIRGYIDRY